MREEQLNTEEKSYQLLGSLLGDQEAGRLTRLPALSAEEQARMNAFFEQHAAEHLGIIQNAASGTNQKKERLHGFLSKVLEGAAIVIAVLSIGLGVALAASGRVRAVLLRLLVRQTPVYTELTLMDDLSVDVPENWKGSYYPAWLPKGTAVTSVVSDSRISILCMKNPQSGKSWDYSFSEYPKDAPVRIDTENANVFTELAGDRVVTVAQKAGLISVWWTDGQKLLLVQSQNSGLEEALAFASGLRRIRP